jgi:hypothetical protein
MEDAAMIEIVPTGSRPRRRDLLEIPWGREFLPPGAESL